ncbi:MAG: hypothetical protein RLZZ161_1270 [Bacteroidota bacterium]|jgi:hypothetical protein
MQYLSNLKRIEKKIAKKYCLTELFGVVSVEWSTLLTQTDQLCHT